MPSHDRQKLRRFIQNVFNDEELGNFCFDYFPQVYNEFTTGMPKSQKVRMLVERAESGSRLRDLHAALSRENPRAYDNAFPEGDGPAKLEPQQPITRNPHQIFISHASADAEFAHRLAADLRAQDWQTWIAPESIRPGEKWVEAINRGLAESGVLVLVLSSAAVDSSYVRDETNFAIELMRHGEAVRVIPVELEPVPPAKIPFTWASLQRIDIRSDYQAGLTALLEELAPEPEGQSLPPSPIKPSKEQPVRSGKLETEENVEPVWNQVWQWLRNLPPAVWFGGAAILFVVLSAIFWPDSWAKTDETPTRVVTSEPGGVAQTADAGSQAVTTYSDVPPANAELGDTWTRSKDGMVMVYVPPPDAPFVLESGVAAPTEGFWIDKYEVSNAQYQLCVDAGVCEPAEYTENDNFNGAEYPVVGVSVYDAETYSAWVGGALPTEGQWEYTAVGNSGFDYPWGDEFDGTRLNFCDRSCGDKGDQDWDDGYDDTAPVGNFPIGASWVGSLNMAGNVWEWTATWWDDTEKERVLRGGSFVNDMPEVRVSYRLSSAPEERFNGAGFRVMIDPNVPPAVAELGDTWTRPKDGMVMVFVPPPDAPFVLESGVDAPIEGFWIDKYEVSNAQYQLCVDAGVCEPSGFMDDDNYNGTNFPVVGVSASDAEIYSAWVGGALPSESQWEYAANGNSGYDYPWGDEFDGSRLNCRDCDNPYPFTAPVDSFLDSKSWVGTLNVVGNVWEWTASWWNQTDEQRIIRGGSWIDSSDDIRISSRSYPNLDYRGATVGFRVVVHVSSPDLTETPTSPSVTEMPTITPTIDPNVPPANAKLGDTWIRPKDGMVMVYVPPPDAPFVLESGVDAPTEGYWIDKYEVNNTQYQLCVDAGVCAPNEYMDDDNFNGAEYPVIGVSAYDAETYSTWVGGALPTEAEWEYAAVGNSELEYPWGNEFDGTRLNFCDVDCQFEQRTEDWNDGYRYTAPVDSFPDGASWVGVFNMAGNVWEWTASWWDETEDLRVVRGGSLGSDRNSAQATSRNADRPALRNGIVGIRVVHRFSFQ